MKNKILYAVLILLVIGAVFFILTKNWDVTSTQTTDQTEEENTSILPNLPDISLPFSSNPKDLAWDLFQKYLEFNRKRDLDGVRSTVYKVAPVCDDPKLILDCQNRMGLAYNYGSILKREDFVNVWSDERQIILSSDLKIQEDDSAISRKRSIIFFIRNEKGDLKLLSFSPSKGVYTTKGDASKEELNERIVLWSEDNDNDGIADYSEECLDAGENACEKTSPKVRDTDGDGWWDGTEIYLK